mgnify:CR=1 FL=1|tara:strand:- start:2031 stop:3665 length:1635 start_codon:yes stop_codon:yes gene_type:complete
MATVNKNFKVKHGLVVEGTTATVNNFDILTKSASDVAYIIDQVGGSGVSANTPDTLVLRDANGDFAAGEISAVSVVLNGDDLSTTLTGIDTDAQGYATAAQSAAQTFATSADTTLYGTVTGDISTAKGEAISAASTDATSKANAALSSAQSYADTAEADAITAAAAYSDGLAGNYDPAGSAAAVSSSANTYTDSLIGDETVDGTGGNTITDRISSAVSDLVAGSPELLDTLNELAAAIGDDANFATTIGTSIGEKVSKSGDTMTGALVLSGAPTLDLHAATKLYADEAQTAAESYADGLAVNYDAAGTGATEAASALVDAKAYTDTEIGTVETTIGNLTTDDVAEGTSQYYTTTRAKTDAASLLVAASKTNIVITGDENGLTITAENGVADSTTTDLVEGSNLYFTNARAQSAVATDISDAVAAGDATATPTYLAVDVNSVSLNVAATQLVATASQVMGYAWASGDYKSAEFVVKIDNGTNTEISKVLLTLDSSNNIAITEYGNVQTSASLGSITAQMSGSDVNLLVTTLDNNSDVTVVGTLTI